MLTRILHNSEKLCTFFDQQDIHLSQPQRRHIVNMADGLLVCEDKKTLASQRCASSLARASSDVEQRFALERSPQVRTYGDIVRRHRDEHAIVWLKGAIQMAVETGNTDLVLQRFLRLEPQPA